MNLQDEIKSLKERIAELEEQVKEEQEFPKIDDEYWIVESTGEIDNGTWEGSSTENDFMSIGNVFKTCEEAEFVVEKLKVEAELRKFTIPFKHDYENYTLCYNHDEGRLAEVNKINAFEGAGEMYFSSLEEVRNAINAVGADRIKKYIFGVED